MTECDTMVVAEKQQAWIATGEAPLETAERGLALPQIVDKIALADNGQGPGWLPYQYRILNLGALANLGFGQRADVPSFDAIRAAFRPADTAWLNRRAAAGYNDRLVTNFSVQTVGLRGDNETPGLLSRYDLGQRRLSKTGVSKIWESIDDKDPLHDNGAQEIVSAAVVLDNQANRLYNGQSPEAPFEAVYRGHLTPEEKQAALVAEQAMQADSGRQIQGITIGQVISFAAQSRIEAKLAKSMSSARVEAQRLGNLCLLHYPEFNESRLTVDDGTYGHQRLYLAERLSSLASQHQVRRVMTLRLEPASS